MTERIEIGGAVAGERKPPTMSPQLSNAERERLLKVARLREKVAKTAAGEHAPPDLSAARCCCSAK